MAEVLRGEGDYNLRTIFRWYSKTYCTPLHQVEDLPLEDVLQTYFETRFEEMEDHDRLQLIGKMLITEEELAAMKKQEDAGDADAWEYGQQALKEAAAAGKAPPVPVAQIAEQVAPKAPGEVAPVTPIPLVELQSLPEDIHMEFDDTPAFAPPDKSR